MSNAILPPTLAVFAVGSTLVYFYDELLYIASLFCEKLINSTHNQEQNQPNPSMIFTPITMYFYIL